MRGFQERYGDLQALGARVAGISADTWAVQDAFCGQNDLEFPVLSDWPELKTIQTFGVANAERPTAQRVTFVFDQEGVLREIIEDARDMEAHPIGALEAVRRLAGGEQGAGSE